MNFNAKFWLLTKVGSCAMPLLITGLALFDFFQGKPTAFFSFQGFKELLFWFLLSGFLTAISGAPILWLIERCFNRAPLRYMYGSLIGSYVLWNLLNTFPPILNGVWFAWDTAVYIAVGMSVGFVFTVLVRRNDASR